MTDWTDFSGNLENSVHISVELLQQIIDNSTNIYERIMVLESLKGGGVPVGAVMIWKGNASTIPDGFQLADGTNGTPDLRGKFVIGIAATEDDDDLNGTGGASTHLHAMGTISSATKHTHTVYLNDSTHTIGNLATGASTVAWGWHNHSWSAVTSSEDKHTHTGTYAAADHLPPYTMYYYIARIPA